MVIVVFVRVCGTLHIEKISLHKKIRSSLSSYEIFLREFFLFLKLL